MANNGRPLVENDEDEVDLRELLAETFKRFQIDKEKDKTKAKTSETRDETKKGETRTDKGKEDQPSSGLRYTLLTVKKRSDGGVDITRAEDATPTTPDPSVRPRTDASTKTSASTAQPPSNKKGPVSRPKLYTEEELWAQWHDSPPQPEMYEPVSVTLEKMQRDNALDNVLCKLREETTPVDKLRLPTRPDILRLVLDFTDVYYEIEKKVKDDDECKRIFRNLFHHDLKALLIRYVNIFKIPTDVSLG